MTGAGTGSSSSGEGPLFSDLPRSHAPGSIPCTPDGEREPEGGEVQGRPGGLRALGRLRGLSARHGVLLLGALTMGLLAVGGFAVLLLPQGGPSPGPVLVRLDAGAPRPDAVERAVSGLLLPLGRGERALLLSFSVRMSSADGPVPELLHDGAFLQDVWESVARLEVRDVSGARGAQALRGRILELLSRRYPQVKVEALGFTDLLIL